MAERNSDAVIGIIRSHDLNESIVQMTLAGFLAAELREVHRVMIPRAAIRRAITSYVAAIDGNPDVVSALTRVLDGWGG